MVYRGLTLIFRSLDSSTKSGKTHEVLFLYVAIPVLTERFQSRGKIMLTLTRDQSWQLLVCQQHTHKYTCYYIRMSKCYSADIFWWTSNKQTWQHVQMFLWCPCFWTQRQILRQRLSCNMLKQQNFFKIKSGLNVTMSTTVSHTQTIHSKNYFKLFIKT